MTIRIILIMCIYLFISCKSEVNKRNYVHSNEENVNSFYEKSEQQTISQDEEDDDGYEYKDGIYCASVEYYDPNTGTSSTYTLNIDVENDNLVTIHWPNGGWLDESHFISEDISSGSCSFTSDKGYEYNVTILGQNCQFTDSSISEDFSDEEEIDIEGEVQPDEETE
ncbi:hypothetical protein [Sphingobacterium thalpophilum]|uniref:hypothetical protein n=1 Tax=Sphingobacterium thalpophilum TaxID=259 RepID=UPI002D79F658|nr:hypothetical protein [Sphingobacterium thalpophilum]